MGNKLVHIVIFLGYFLTVGMMFGISAYVMLQGITGWGYYEQRPRKYRYVMIIGDRWYKKQARKDLKYPVEDYTKKIPRF